jgi:hypothetical protein
MIRIQNNGHGDGTPDGWAEYEIYVNRAFLTTFRHKRSDGMAVCLARAAQAVSRMEEGLPSPEYYKKLMRELLNWDLG